jgi:hypothetical protein
MHPVLKELVLKELRFSKGFAMTQFQMETDSVQVIKISVTVFRG